MKIKHYNFHIFNYYNIYIVYIHLNNLHVLSFFLTRVSITLVPISNYSRQQRTIKITRRGKETT